MSERNFKRAWSQVRTLAAEISGAARQGVRERDVRRAMARASYGLGVALAAVAALSVHEAIHAVWR